MMYSLLALFFCTFSNADQSHIGEIRYSILTPEQFREKYGEEWDLMKGQTLDPNSDLRQLWGQPNVPDARGIFLRCSNQGRTRESGNPYGDIAIGHYQGDENKAHNHTDSGHGHGFDLHFGTTENLGGAHAPGRGSGHQGDRTGVRGSIHTAHAQIQPSGSRECRPRNMTVNAFIKLREPAAEVVGNAVGEAAAQPENQGPLLTRAMKFEMTQSPEFQAAVEHAVTEIMNHMNR